MSACIPRTTAGASCLTASSKMPSIQSSAAASRAVYSRARSAVSAVVSGTGLPAASRRVPYQGAWLSLEPTTWTVPYCTRPDRHMTFSGKARDWNLTVSGRWPSVLPGCEKNMLRSVARRSVGR